MSVDDTLNLLAFVPQPPDELNAQIGPHLEISELIGYGGMGADYRAEQVRLGREVAIKVLPDLASTEDWDFNERFLNEARALAKLDHPSIVKIHDFGETAAGRHYFVMEYVDGVGLQHLIEDGSLTEEHITSWVPQMCRALDYAHGRELVHRDVKPGNVMITLEGQVKIMDFGLVKMRAGAGRAGLTQARMSVGTPNYLAPEAMDSGGDVDHRADIYSMGVVLYELLTGRIPRGAWKAPSEVNPEIDPRYDAVVIRAMQEEPGLRFERIVELGEEVLAIGQTPRIRTKVLNVGAPLPPKRLNLEVLPSDEVGRSGVIVRP